MQSPATGCNPTYPYEISVTCRFQTHPIAPKLLHIYLVGTGDGVIGTFAANRQAGLSLHREAKMFWTIVGAILAAAAILFIIACLLGAWIEHRERQAEIDWRQALRKGEERYQAEQQEKRLEDHQR